MTLCYDFSPVLFKPTKAGKIRSNRVQLSAFVAMNYACSEDMICNSTMDKSEI